MTTPGVPGRHSVPEDDLAAARRAFRRACERLIWFQLQLRDALEPIDQAECALDEGNSDEVEKCLMDASHALADCAAARGGPARMTANSGMASRSPSRLTA